MGEFGGLSELNSHIYVHVQYLYAYICQYEESLYRGLEYVTLLSWISACSVKPVQHFITIDVRTRTILERTILNPITILKFSKFVAIE